MDIVIPNIWLQINFCLYVDITLNYPVIHKQGFFSKLNIWKNLKSGLDWYASPKNGSNLSMDIVIPNIWLQINFCSYVGITYNHPVIHKQVLFSLIKYLKISNLVWIATCHLKNDSHLSMDIVIPYIWLQINFCFICGYHIIMLSSIKRFFFLN